MARKPGGSNRSINKVMEYSTEDMVHGIFNNHYILVIGSGVILNRSKFPESNGDVNRYIISEINKDRRNQIKEYVDESSFEGIIRSTPPSYDDPINYLLTEEFEYNIDDISPELVNLLRTRLFRVVMTTTVDEYLETLLRDIWGDQLQVVNIEDPSSLRDFQQELANYEKRGSSDSNYFRPTLFYVFGKAVRGQGRRRNFVETDIDAIKCIEKWIKLGEGKDNIIPFLKKKNFISFGCKFDDWYFRFFWYIITRRFGQSEITDNYSGYDNLAIHLGLDSGEENLKKYLSSLDVCIHNDEWGFMSSLYEMLTSTSAESPFWRLVLDKRRQGGIFISYCSDDVLAASELFCKLEVENGFNVWFDNIKLHSGSDYMNTIHEAIRHSKILIPVLSPTVEKALLEKGVGLDTFYADEWRWAADIKDLTILPVAVGGYSLKGKAQGVFEEIIHKQHPSGIDLSVFSPKDPENPKELVGYQRLLNDIKLILGV